VVLSPLGGDDFAVLGSGFAALVVRTKGSGTILLGAAVGAEARRRMALCSGTYRKWALRVLIPSNRLQCHSPR
jgi:hypothetical protein